MRNYTKAPLRCNPNPRASRDVELVAIPAVRAILRRVNVSPVVAFTLAALSGFNVGAR